MSRSYRFDRFELRPTERLLYVQGDPAPLGSRAIDLLLALVERHGCLVTKHELLDLVWPGVVVEENNLQVQVSTLRKVLGARSIVTVPGRGYRFVEPVVVDSGAASGPPPTARTSDSVEALWAAATADSPLSVLPALPSRILGRDRDLAALEDLADRPLVTIVGPGGIGKTALALAAAHAGQRRMRDGVAWVELAAITDPALVVTVVAQALGLPTNADAPLASLLVGLRPLNVLLVLDNAEHLLDAVVHLVNAIVEAAPQVRVLVTSQLALKVPAEQVFRLNALSVPEHGASMDEALAHGAVALFVDQAQAADRRFALADANVAMVIALCHRLDGVALAIKLAASRMPLLGLQGIWMRLDERFRLLASRGTQNLLPARHQTLLAALEWSHDLLGPDEQAVFRRLSVFSGGFSLALASVVTSDDRLDEWTVIDLLGELVDRSLVSVDAVLEGADAPRYRLLESTLAFAELKLADSSEREAIAQRHARAVAGLIDRAYEDYWAMPDNAWLNTYGPEIDNVRKALEWARQNDPALAVTLVGAASVLFLLLGLAPECRQHALALQAQAESMPAGESLARYWVERSRLHWGISNGLMHEFALRAAKQCRDVGDQRGLYMALRCQAGSGVVSPQDAMGLLDEMARLEHSGWPVRLKLQRLLAEVGVLKAGDFMIEARLVCDTLLIRAQAAGLDAVVSATLSDLASVSLALGDTDAAIRACRKLLSRGRHRRDNFVLHALAIVASASLIQGDAHQARGSLTDFVAASRSRDWEWLGLYSGLLALLAAVEGRHEAAARVLGHADQAYRQLGSRDAQALKARAQAKALIQQALDATAIERLSAEGADMDPETLCAWALARDDA
ncbi:MAG: ATP-binding protein [Pseudomonadota bacterium]